jgi:hypothetical protein
LSVQTFASDVSDYLKDGESTLLGGPGVAKVLSDVNA